jgi:hypothetical protein
VRVCDVQSDPVGLPGADVITLTFRVSYLSGSKLFKTHQLNTLTPDISFTILRLRKVRNAIQRDIGSVFYWQN